MEELIDVLNENGEKTGEVKTKSSIKKDGDFHRAVSICIINDHKEILMHRRSVGKKIYPNLWSCFVRGHVSAGEDSIAACLRELDEELGILAHEDDLEFLFSLKDCNRAGNMDYINNIFYDNYLLFKNIPLGDLALEAEEVAEVRYMNYKEVKELVEKKEKTLIPNFEEYEKLFPLIDKREIKEV